MIRTLRRLAGRCLAPVTVWRWRRRDAQAARLTGLTVASGLFQGMRYIDRAGGSALAPKLVGSYELELADVLRAVIADLVGRPEPMVIDLGAAEGWYAVGLARALPSARVVAWEADPTSRELLGQLAARNGVADRIETRGPADVDALTALLDRCGPSVALLICDVEGAEVDLLDPRRVPGLATCPMLVETHQHLAPGVTDLLEGRFEPTHRVARITARPRIAADWPARLGRCRRALMDELRVLPQSWLWMTPR